MGETSSFNRRRVPRSRIEGLSDFIKSKEALLGLLIEFSDVRIEGDALRVIPMKGVSSHLQSHTATLVTLCVEFFGRPTRVEIAPEAENTSDGRQPAMKSKIAEVSPDDVGTSNEPVDIVPGSAGGERRQRVNELHKTAIHARVSYALAYARHGIPVFPCFHIDVDHECSCGKLSCPSDAGKHPRIKGWQSEATKDESVIRGWWSNYPEANVGVLCGVGSGITVLDVDGESGRQTLRELELQHGELPETPIATTGSGGAHYYFLHEPGLSNAVRFAPGLDIRTDGGFVVGVGSQTLGRYEWETIARLCGGARRSPRNSGSSVHLRAGGVI